MTQSQKEKIILKSLPSSAGRIIKGTSNSNTQINRSVKKVYKKFGKDLSELSRN